MSTLIISSHCWCRLPRLFIFILLASILAGCGSGSGGGIGFNLGGGSGAANPDTWTWVSGANISNQASNYGMLGIVDAANIPGARSYSTTWIDSNGNLWLFGGLGRDNVGAYGNLNDLWRWDGTNWTWISGSKTVYQTGVYGTLDTPDASNVPGARQGAGGWIDSSDNLWLFGGGYEDGSNWRFNDLWRWDGTNWTWVSGTNTKNGAGTYGTKGTPNGANIPGARDGFASWRDSSGDFWLFGGKGYDKDVNSLDSLNDLWRWDGINWTWMSGSDVIIQPGVYGVKGTANGTNIPGARNSAVSWTDSNGDFWLFGGLGRDSVNSTGRLNDLWRWDGTNWIWVSGSNTINQIASYGSLKTAKASNLPGARFDAISWTDSDDNLWLFGGSGFDSTGNTGGLNDLWRWDGANWRWVSGSNIRNQFSTYGTRGVPDADKQLGGRVAPLRWIDSSDNLWLLGGYDVMAGGEMNDLWKYEP